MGRKVITYDATNDWKCSKSPTNAHHWVEAQWTKDGWQHTGLFYCQYCYDARRFPVYWSQINPYRGGIVMED